MNTSTKKVFEIGFWVTTYGTMEVEADNEREAELIAEQAATYGIECEGFDEEFEEIKSVKINDRDTGSQAN